MSTNSWRRTYGRRVADTCMDLRILCQRGRALSPDETAKLLRQIETRLLRLEREGEMADQVQRQLLRLVRGGAWWYPDEESGDELEPAAANNEGGR